MPPETENSLYTDSDETETDITSESEGEEADENMPTAIVPKDVFAGKSLEVGDTVKMRVVGIQEDSVEIQCEHEYGDEEKTEKPMAEVPNEMME